MWLYLFTSRTKYAVKIGITRRKLAKRVREEYKRNPCRFFMAVPLVCNWWFEKWLHRHYAHLNRKDMDGTEWFYFWLPVRPALWLLFFFLFELFCLTLIVYLIWQLQQV